MRTAEPINRNCSASAKQVLETCGIDVVENLSVKDFFQNYRKLRKPVLIKDATKNWHGCSWTPEYFQERVGHKEVAIRTKTGTINRNFGDLLEEIKVSSDDQPAEYARNINVEKELPELWNDIRPRIAYAKRDWKSSRLIPKDLVFQNYLEELFVGGRGASFPRLHVDYYGMDGFVSQLYGHKDFYLIAPEDTKYVYADPNEPLTSLIPNIAQVDTERFPLFKQANLMKIRLEPGDTLYNPHGWWHTSYMPETSITVITATWHRHNWLEFMKQYKARTKHGKLTKMLTLGQMLIAGGVLGVGDLFGNG